MPETLAKLHGRAFAGLGRAWSAAEFAEILESELVFLVGDDRAFAVGRVVGAEAELLTLATAPEHQRQGLGGDRLAAFEAEAQKRGAERLFLDVAAENTGAISLYHAAGYAEISRRKRYYTVSDGTRVDAIVMVKRASRPRSRAVG